MADRAEAHSGQAQDRIASVLHRSSCGEQPIAVDEYTFRYNNRDNEYLFRDTLLRLIDAERMPYAELIAS